MRALVCKAFGAIEDLTVEEIPAPVVAPGSVLIEMRAASINFPDTLLVQGRYQVQPELPFVPGSELAGIVLSVGEGVTHVAPGAPVLALPMRGAFAEQVCVAAQAVLPLDRSIDMAQAAALPMTYGTVYHALLDRAQLQAGETLLVLGAGGGIGLAAVELGRVMGARVIAAASSDEKLAAARDRGAQFLIDYTRNDLRAQLKEITQGRGVDVVCDPVGGAHSEPALRSTGWRGRYLVIGFAGGEIPRVPLNLPLLKGSAIVGVFWGDFLRREPQRGREELRTLVDWLGAKRIQPLVTREFPLAQGAQALGAIAGRRVTGKIVLVP